MKETKKQTLSMIVRPFQRDAEKGIMPSVLILTLCAGGEGDELRETHA